MLYSGYIRRLEIELELAHEREKRLLDELLRAKSVDRVHSTTEEQVPVNPRMSFKEAARRVKEFERSQREKLEELSDASEISEAISADAGRGVKEGQGYAI